MSLHSRAAYKRSVGGLFLRSPAPCHRRQHRSRRALCRAQKALDDPQGTVICLGEALFGTFTRRGERCCSFGPARCRSSLGEEAEKQLFRKRSPMCGCAQIAWRTRRALLVIRSNLGTTIFKYRFMFSLVCRLCSFFRLTSRPPYARYRIGELSCI